MLFAARAPGSSTRASVVMYKEPVSSHFFWVRGRGRFGKRALGCRTGRGAMKRRSPEAPFRVPVVVPAFGLVASLAALAVTFGVGT